MSNTTILVFASVTAVVALGTFAWVLRPFWRARPAPAMLTIAGLIVLSALLYRVVGTPAALDARALRGPETIEEAVAELERNTSRFTDHEGWVLLASSYAKLGKTAQARDAWDKALQYKPDEPDFLAAAAESRAKADTEHRFDERAVAMLRHALQINPSHQRAQLMLGAALRQQGKHAEAATVWETLLGQLDAGNAKALRTEIDAARAAAGMPPLPPAATQVAAPTDTSITVEVTLDPDFASRVRLRGDTSVFVIARAPGGPPMPLAVEKHRVSDLPLTVTLDDSDGPMPTARLSTAKQVELIARLSESGNAMRQEGDLESEPVVVDLPVTRKIPLILGGD